MFLLLCLVLCGSSLQLSSTHHAQQHWDRVGKENVDKVFTAKIVLKPLDEEKLNNLFIVLSDPTNPKFTDYPEQEDRCLFVKRNDVSSLLSFLDKNSIEVVTKNKCEDVWMLKGSGVAFETAFGLSLHVFKHRMDESFVITASDSNPVVPRELESLIQVFHGFHFPVLSKKMKTTMMKKSAEFADATPQILKKLYNVTDGPVTNSKASQGVAGWEHQSYSEGDLADFESHYSLPKQTIRKVYGHNTDFPHMESNLDTQYIIGMGTGIPTDFYLNSGLSFDVLDWITDVENEDLPALVWSLSYGEDLKMKTASYAQSVDQKMKQLATRGVTILVASGDSGAMSRQSVGFAPEFPASLPSCTAVGATVLNENYTETSAVSCDYGWCSGGGFTFPDYFSLNASAPWQVDAVNTYFNTAKLPPAKDYSSMVGGVGFPDIAAIGTNHEIYYYRFRTGVGGTSASTPSTAGTISLLNDARMNAGKKPLGFLNQMFYQNPSLFHDIEVGNTGWFAAKGWDATTGLGSIKYQELKNYVMSLK